MGNRALRTGCALLSVLAGVGLLTVRSGAGTAPHAAVFQSEAEAAAIGGFYARPGQLPTGETIFAASFGYSRAQVSILNTLGIGAYLWMGDLAPGYRESIVLAAEQAPAQFKQVILSGPDYPFMARAAVPGESRSEENSLSGPVRPSGGLSLEAGRATATADDDAATGRAVIGALRIDAPAQLSDGLQTFRRQVAAATGRTVTPSDPGALLRVDGGRTSTVSSFEGTRLVVRSDARVSELTLLEGTIQIGTVEASAVASSDGIAATVTPRTQLTAVDAFGYQAVIDADGVRIADRTLSAEQARTVQDALTGALAAGGVEIRTATSSSRTGSGPDLVRADAAALDVTIRVEKTSGPMRDSLPAPLQQAISGDRLRLSVGVASAAAAVAEDVALTIVEDVPATPSVPGWATQVQGTREGDALAAQPATQPSSAAGVPADAALLPPEVLRTRPAVAWLGVPLWAVGAAVAAMLLVAAALSIAGVWQML